MKTKLIILIISVLFAFGCGNLSYEEGKSAPDMPAKVYATSVENATSSADKFTESELKQSKKTQSNDETTTDDKIEPKIIKTADIAMEIEEYDIIKAQIYSNLKKWNGYISKENETNESWRTSNTLIIKVPKENFDTLVAVIASAASELNYKNISLQDVTAEFVDMQSRLKNKKETEEQYRTILKQAKTIEEILRVNEYIRQLREEIEATEGRLKYLTNRVSFSTINLEFYKVYETEYRGFGGKVADGLENGWKGVLFFIVGLANIWPTILVFIAIFFGLRFIYRRRKRRRKTS